MIINQNIERLSKSKAEIKWEQQGLDFPRKKNEMEKHRNCRMIGILRTVALSGSGLEH